MEENRFDFLKKSTEVKEDLKSLASKYGISNLQICHIVEELKKDENEKIRRIKIEKNKELIGKCYIDNSDDDTIEYYKILSIDENNEYYVTVMYFDLNSSFYFHETDNDKMKVFYGFEITSVYVDFLEKECMEINREDYNKTAIQYLNKILEI